MFDLLFKKSKSGEKEQDIEVIKQNDYKKVITVIAIILVALCFFNEVFPSLEVSPWWYHQTERVLNFMLNE